MMSLPRIISLDGDWDFAYTPSLKEGAIPALPARDRFEARMPVPGYWDDHLGGLKKAGWWRKARFNPDYRPIKMPAEEAPPDTSLPFLVGVGWYRKTFVSPPTVAPPSPGGHGGRGTASDFARIATSDMMVDKPAATDASVTLVVGGVVLEAWVWLNGRYAGYHLGHSTPFEVSLDRFLKPGAENELTIAVANTRRDRVGCVIRGYAGMTGGVVRSVHLKIAGRRHIRSVYLCPTPDLKTLSWRVDLAGSGEGVLHYAVRDSKNGDAILEGAIPTRSREAQFRMTGRNACLTGAIPARAREVRWRTPARGLTPWSVHSPRLYTIDVRLEAGGRETDRVVQPFGLRRLARRGTALRLNGEPVFLRGICEHAYFPLTCTPPSGKATYLKRLRILKSLGFNWLRFHTWAPSEEYMAAADELGMMIQVEPPWGFGEQEWLDILRHCRRHPSVVLYCCGNEELLDDAKIRELRRLARQCREIAPDALFNPQEALRGVEYFYRASNLGRGAVRKPYPHNPRRLRALKSFSDAFGAYAWGLLSYVSVKADWRLIDGRLKPYGRPCLSHELGIHGSYLDLSLERRYAGTRIGPSLYAAVRRALKKAGLLHKAELYYRNSCAWMNRSRKHNFEMARLCRRLAGYDFLSAYDHHWHRTGYPCGMMNEFLELKPGESRTDVLRYNGESVLLLDHDVRRNYTAGDPFAADLHLSYFGAAPMSGGRLSWRLASREGRAPLAKPGAWSRPPLRVHASGGWEVPVVSPGQVRRLGRIRLDMPAVERGRQLVLQVRLAGGTREIANEWSFWVFPRPDIAPRKNVVADAAIRPKFLLSQNPVGFQMWNRLPACFLNKQAGRPHHFEEIQPDFAAKAKFGSWLTGAPGTAGLPAILSAVALAKVEAPGATAGTRVFVVSRLTSETLACLERGGRVILLGHAPFPAEPTTFQISVAGRVRGNLATVIADHPLMRMFPHEGFCDWQFHDLLEDGFAVDFNELPVVFEPIVEVVSSFKRIVKQAALFELAVGRGRLLVCSLNIQPGDPAARFLLDRMLDYAAGDRFAPSVRLSPSALSRMIRTGAVVRGPWTTDRALDKNMLKRRKRTE